MQNVTHPKAGLPLDQRYRKIKAFLDIEGVKLTDIARELKVSVPTVSKVAGGKARSRRVEEAISQALGLKREDLWPNRKKRP